MSWTLSGVGGGSFGVGTSVAVRKTSARAVFTGNTK